MKMDNYTKIKLVIRMAVGHGICFFPGKLIGTLFIGSGLDVGFRLQELESTLLVISNHGKHRPD